MTNAEKYLKDMDKEYGLSVSLNNYIAKHVVNLDFVETILEFWGEEANDD